MNIRLDAPRSRLICFGGARDLTNAVEFLPNPEDNPIYGFGE